ncbi:MAG: polyprenyl synthetase family protein [Dehalogenimonas sp.]|uniref:Polyprenyl synthetase family protein n=1 Tax=Candidatus Dehalogenimonas loeffleri TaxID=3127115 RepID=A0ABZ2J4J5_9CHLR|nr:polyprenyl synthetase family protein [Dehalogenimonas sp.]
MDLKSMYNPVARDLAAVEANFIGLADKWQTEFPELHDMLRHTLTGGKILRPALTFLAGRCLDDKTDRILNMATANELLHISTLIHDDAIDHADTRRGKLTVNNIWGLEKAILLGDFLFARAGEFAAATDNLRTVKMFSNTLQTIAVGELRQARDVFSPRQSREGYFQRISGKTASLLRMSTESGAVLADGTEEQIQALSDFGYNLGLAFQIVDDILDFTGTEKELGKPVGSDLRQGTITLPALLLMEQQPEDNPVKDFLEGKDRENSIIRVINIIKSTGLIDESYALAVTYSEIALALLDTLPPSVYRETLKKLTSYLIRRRV